MKFRKKPVVIEAVRWDGEHKTLKAPELEGLRWKGVESSDHSLIIETLEGDHKAMVGDYIIKGVKGEFYPCKPDIFAATYESAEPTGVSLIADERAAHPTREGWTPEHDDQHDRGEMVEASICYAAQTLNPRPVARWPWGGQWWKPKDPIRNLVKAGALIAAEIDRLLRKQKV
jgi:hypothetical protein